MTSLSRARLLAQDDSRALAADVVAARWSLDDAPCRAEIPIVHSHATLAFHVRGASRVEQAGAWTVREGDVLLVPAGAPHRALERRGSTAWGLSFSMTSFGRDDEAALVAPFERVRDGASPVIAIPGARHAFLEAIFAELERVGGAPFAPTSTIARRSLLALILHEIGNAARTSVPDAGARKPLVAESLRFIERNCLRRLTLEDVATAVHRSPAHVTSALKAATGRSAGAWITSGRMAEARRLLGCCDDGIESVAARVGYADATHFIRMFRRVHGATPAAWRAMRRA